MNMKCVNSFLINVNDLDEDKLDSHYIYENFFNDPVKRVFYWNQGGYEGSIGYEGIIFCVFNFENTFIVLDSYSRCDVWKNIRDHG